MSRPAKEDQVKGAADPVSYEVGYRRPPQATRFKPGCSGNPKGRPKGSKGLKTLLDDALSATVTITEDGVTRRIQRREALCMTLVAKAIKGDPRSAGLVFNLMEKFDLNLSDDNQMKLIIRWRDEDDEKTS